MKQKYLSIVVILCIIISGCLDNKSDSGEQKKTKAKQFTVFFTGIRGFSGLCNKKANETFLALSDRNGIYEINKEGKVIRTLPFSSSYDFEGIAHNPITHDIYLADEGQMKIFKLSKDEKTVQLITEILISGLKTNKGIEGLTFGNDTLYIVNQASPSMLIKYDLKSNREISRVKLDYAEYLSDIDFDESDNTLWISDSKNQKIFHTDLEGNLIDFQSIKFVKKAEAIKVDRLGKTVWIGCDETGLLYKVKLKI